MKSGRIISACGFLALIIAVLLTVIDWAGFDKKFYQKEYSRDHTAERIGMSEESLMESTYALLDYLRDERDDIVVIAEVNGSEREVFDTRETLHMQDVKELYQNAVFARNALAVIGLVLLLYVQFRKKDPADILFDGYVSAFIMIAVFVAVTGIYALIDFDNFWIQFHYLFFDNDLFFLDPAVSIMINMFPGIFFSDMVFRIILVFGMTVILTGILLYVYRRHSHDQYRFI